MSAREVIARRHCQGNLEGTYPCSTTCGACLSRADGDLAALREARLVVVDAALLSEAADDLAAYVDAEYAASTGGPHPALAAKYERDMDVVTQLRAAAQEDRR